MIITDHAAQMIVAGPETGHGWWPGVLLINDDPDNEIYFDVHPNIFNEAGSPNYVLPPGGTVALTSRQTFWARAPQRARVSVHVVPTGTYGAPGAAAAVR